jgi:cytochrome c-type biogenesis protein CcmE
MNDTVILTPEEQRARKRRNLWIALSILAFVALVFLVTLARVGASLS